MNNFLEILLEADKITIKSDKSNNDYTEDANNEDPPVADENPSDQQNDEGQDSNSQDYTEGSETLDPEDDTDGEGDATDYTDGDDSDSSDEDSNNDYTDGTGDDSNDDSTDTPSDDTDTESTPEEENEVLNNRLLLSDITDFFYMNKSIVNKLSEVNRADILINQIINQVKSNLTELHKQLFDYITRQFSKTKYVKNLYKYNYFIEAFRVNVEMLKKISVLSVNG